ncbi:MAG: DoxX family protein [Porticoccus sp.]|jgi:putative oxidoreductase|uniref:DoxX family protein n=1 Tax=Porticoccus sp. Uisw_050_02 TaxID=3230978 RepID=UPI001D85F4CB|nr:DoxX family protein [Porticoccus sp.]|tara:strand:- start:17126 stop:17521 length:396 start_codon:yes stop_codon:yes gene_type:complete
MLHSESLAKLSLRLAVGILLLFHGIDKIIDPSSIEKIGENLADFNLHPLLSYGVYLGEVLAPLMIIIGIKTRVGAFIIAINMIFAILLFHSHQLLQTDNYGGWALELQGFYLIGAVIIFLQGSGQYAVRPS